MIEHEALRGFSKKHLLCILLCMFLTCLALALLGRSWWCSAGDWNIWAGGVESRHNSQHVLDPYSLTHVLHGIGFYPLIWLLLRRYANPASRFVTVLVLECGWEILENTNFIIDKYREETAALGYLGDSIVNSLADIVACGIGYLIAAVIPVAGSIALFCLTEALLLWWIRDSLLLNILMLLWPLDSVRKWQMASLGVLWARRARKSGS